MGKTLIECKAYDREFKLFNVYRSEPNLAYITDHGFEKFVLYCAREKRKPPKHEDTTVIVLRDGTVDEKEVAFHRWRMVDALRKQMEQRGIEV